MDKKTLEQAIKDKLERRGKQRMDERPFDY